MKANISPEDLILYLYRETTPEQNQYIELALQEDWTLMEKFKVLKASVNRLNDLKQCPRTEAVLNILHYAADKNAEMINTCQHQTNK